MIKRCKNIFVFLVVSCFAFAITSTVAADTINLVEGTDYTLNYSEASPINVDTYTVSVTGIGNYSGTTSTASFAIGAKQLDVTKFDYGTKTKVYDGNTSTPTGFAITPTTASGLVTGDNVTVTKTGAVYNDENVNDATSITVTGMALTGTDAGNYSLNNTSYEVTGATITPKQLTVGNFTFNPKTKVYDGEKTEPSGFTITPSGLVTGDNVTVTKTGAVYNDEDVNDATSITVTGMALTGTDAGNYSLNNTSYEVTGATITPKQLAVENFTYSPTEKEYDGTTEVPGFTITPSGIVTGDSVTVTGTAAYNNANVARQDGNPTGEVIADRTIYVRNMTLGGTDKDNYSLSSNSYNVTGAKITPFDISKQGSTVSVDPDTFTYNGNEQVPTTITLTFEDRTLVINNGVSIGG